MEITIAILKLKKLLQGFLVLIFLIFFLYTKVSGQAPIKIYTIKDGRIYIELSKHIGQMSLDSFISHYDLAELALNAFIKTNMQDSLKAQGWRIEKDNKDVCAISKPLTGSDNLSNLADIIVFIAKQPNIGSSFPLVNNGVVYGYNHFKNKSSFVTLDSVVTFYVRNDEKANKVFLAGSFNNWDPVGIPMIKTDSGWIANVKLNAGKYLYKFIIDDRWKLDEDNLQREKDGKDYINSVFYKTNYVFILNAHTDAKKVYLAGSFNNWQSKELLMHRSATGWELPLYLAQGTYTYKYVVDGNWMVDPDNPERYPNGNNGFNSVLHFGKPYLFRLKGYENAKQVVLTGSFNKWNKDELAMIKTDSGWELPYILGAGNYEYKFIVDTIWIIDPSNPSYTSEDKKTANSYLVIDPNYTFRLKGYPDAKKVFLSGDFNGFSPNSLSMMHEDNEWVFSIHLTAGKHIYKFVVDSNWIRDPANKLWEQNKYGTDDSVIWFDE